MTTHGAHVSDSATSRQRLLWRLEAFGYDVFTFLLRLLPVDAASAMGGWLLRTLGPLTGTHKIARANIELAFPRRTPPGRPNC